LTSYGRPPLRLRPLQAVPPRLQPAGLEAATALQMADSGTARVQAAVEVLQPASCRL